MRLILSLFALVVGLSGCVVTSIDGQRMPLRSDDFSAYVEAVFRRQNEVATELAFAIDNESLGSERFSILEDAELELQAACRGLNQVARARRNGESVGGFGALNRARGAPDCELATDDAAALL